MKKIVLLFPLLLVACKIDHAQVEDSIKKEFKAKNIELKSVSCPADIPAKTGDKFDCKAEDGNGTPFTINVTQAGGGGFEWKQQGKIYEASAIASQLKEKGVDADCGSSSFVGVKGAKLDCKAGGKTLTVKFTDDEGKIHWGDDDAKEEKKDDKKEEKKDE